jgi:hypothetical protein
MSDYEVILIASLSGLSLILMVMKITRKTRKIDHLEAACHHLEASKQEKLEEIKKMLSANTCVEHLDEFKTFVLKADDLIQNIKKLKN